MNFEFTEEQTLLSESVQRFVADNYDYDSRKALTGSELGFSEKNWSVFAEMGWLALPFSEEVDGLGGSFSDIVVLSETLGRGITLDPFVANALLAGKLVELLGDSTQKSDILAAVMGGEKKLALAYGEPQARFDITNVETVATLSDGGIRLKGHKSVVLDAHCADHFVVIARTTDGKGLSAFLVDADAEGIRRQDYKLVDSHRASDIWFDNTPAVPLGEEGQAKAALTAAINVATCAVCAEAVGAMETALELTKEYIDTRKQFGKPIGHNQVLQHRLVDMNIALQEARSITYLTAMRIDEGEADTAHEISGMKYKVGKCARYVGEQALQLHGGIGMTDECAVGHYYKRLIAIDTLFGDQNYHLSRFAKAM